jgi:serine/threonine protein kinase
VNGHARQCCGALRASHAAGLIHRDIKPSNIFAARPGGLGDEAKLVEFGLVLPAAILGEATLTGERQILGTPHAAAGKLRTGVGRTSALTINTDVRIIPSRARLVFAVRRSELLDAVGFRSGDGPGTDSLEGWLVTVRSLSVERPSASQRR